jgi:hypothetical protein
VLATTAVATTAVATTAVATNVTTYVAAYVTTSSSVSEERGTVREEPPAVLRQLGVQRRARK